MLIKESHSVKMPVTALNTPQGWEEFVLPKQIKIASINSDASNEDLGGFDLKEATQKHPDNLYIKIFAIKKDEVNDNGDAFSANELRKAADSFVGVPLFTNHQNDDVEKSRGECVHSWYDADAGGIYIIGRVDKVAYPKLARGIESGYITGTSMGCLLGRNRVLMGDGTYKNICEVRKDDEVITHKGRVRKVKNLQVHEDKTNDTIYKIKVEGLPEVICATKEHPFYVLKEQDTCFVTGDYLGTPKSRKNKFRRRIKSGVYQKEEYKVALAEGKFDEFDYTWREAKDLKEGDKLTFPVSNEEVDSEDATVAKARLIGYFLSEGSFLKRKGIHTSVEFNLSLSKEKDTLGREIIGLLREVFTDSPNEPWTQERPERDTYVVHMSGKDISSWFYRYCGEYSHKKQLNQECLFWPKEIQKHILAAWINGDGTVRRIYHRNGRVYENLVGTTASEVMHYQMKFIASRLNIYTTTEEIKERAIEKGKKPYWNVVFGCKESQKLNDVLGEDRIVKGEYKDSWFRQTCDYMVMPIKSIETEFNTEPVYNLEVEDDNSFIVEGVAVHNCSVEFSCCSVCHCFSKTADDYCSHIKERKNRKYSGDIKCRYFDNKDAEGDRCPVCSSTKADAKTLSHKEQQIFEHNYGLKFIENSFVVNPACHECGVTCILNEPEIEKKVASAIAAVDSILKYSDDVEHQENISKFGGVKELSSLKNSMEQLKTVMSSMMKQSDNVSMEYVTEIAKAVSDIQGTYDELNEMGYGRLPSPEGIEAAGADMGDINAFPDVAQQPEVPVTPELSGEVSSGELGGGLGTVTKPKFSHSLQRKIKEFGDENEKTTNKLSVVRDNLSNLQAHRRTKMADTVTKVSSDTDNRHIVISEEKEGVFVTEMSGDEIAKVSNLSQFPEEMQELIKSNPHQAAKELLDTIKKETGVDMTTKTTKVAADMGNQEIITEKQLDKKQEPLHSRKDEAYETITEGDEQIGRNSDLENLTTSDTPQHRRGTYETITQDQFDKEKSGYVVRWDDMLDVITEKQWDDMSRLVSANIPDDYTENITDGQLRDLLASHTYCGPVEVITEKQFADRVNYQELNRWANSEYTQSLVKTAVSVIADAITKFDKRIEDIKKVSSYVNSSTDKKDKVAKLTLLNNLPWKKADRVKVAENYSFNKLASKSNDVTALDAFIIAVADNATFPQKAEDVLDAISHALESKKALGQVESKVAERRQGGDVVKQADAFENAIKQVDRPEDGRYQIMATMQDIGVSPKDKVAFTQAVKKFAQEVIDDEGVAAAVIKIQVGEDGNSLIIDIEDGAESDISPDDIGDFVEGPVEDIVEDTGIDEGIEGEIEEETNDMGGMPPGTGAPAESPAAGSTPTVSKSGNKTKLSAAREEIKKQAQMLGGEMGGQGGVSQGPGAGATLPQPPADPASQAPLESFSDEGDMGADDEFEEDLEASPPGTHCVVCTSKDVDIVDGRGKCNNCGSEMTFKVAIEVTKYTGITPNTEEGGEGEEGIGEGEGFDLSEGMEAAPEAGGMGGMGGMGAPETPAMASVVKINPASLQKLASIQERAKEASENKEEIKKISEETGISVANLNKMATEVITPGSISPETGSADTFDLGKGHYVCMASGRKYKVSFVTDKKGQSLYGQWEWNPKVSSRDCPSCTRAKGRFVKALSSVDVTEEKFEKMSLSDKVATIKQLKESGKLSSVIKVADKQGDIVGDYKLAYGSFGETFPTENCVEKIARRFGKNALALSGPCEGKNLADCLCNNLKSAGVYSDNLAYKVASSWSDCDGDEQCITHQVREGYSLREATAICETLKLAVASPIDLFASELKSAQFGDVAVEEESPVDDVVEEDPFEDGAIDEGDAIDGGQVTLTLSTETAEELKTELETSDVGGDVEGELGGGVPVEEDALGDGSPVEEVVEPGDLSPMDDGNGAMKPMDNGECSAVTPEEGVEFEGDVPGEDIPGGGSPKVTVNDRTGGGTEDMAYMASGQSDGYTYKEASYMSSKVGKTGQMGLDLSGVIDIVQKEAGEKQVEHKNVQDVAEIGTYSAGEDGSKMGHENETIPSAGKPSVPRNNATMGQEPTDLNPQDKPQPVIPSDKGTMGHEDEQGLSGGDHSYTGGVDGAGKTETASVDEDIYHMRGFGNSSSGLERLARRILEAGEKKVDSVKPVADDSDIQPVSGESTMGKEPPLTLETPQNVKGSGNESQMGHENESLGDRPDSPSGHPTIPADNQLMGQEDDGIAPEKQTNIKGTVLADGESESEAYRVAGRMLEQGKIVANELQQKIAELSGYKPAQIRDIEKGIFAGEKGLDTVSDGKLSQAVIINEASNQRNSGDLSNKLASLFTIEQQNRWADSDEGTQLRKTFGRN